MEGNQILFGGARGSNSLGVSKLEYHYIMFMQREDKECIWLSPNKEAAESAKSKLKKFPLIKVGGIIEEQGNLFTFVVSKLTTEQKD